MKTDYVLEEILWLDRDQLQTITQAYEREQTRYLAKETDRKGLAENQGREEKTTGLQRRNVDVRVLHKQDMDMEGVRHGSHPAQRPTARPQT